MIIDVMRLHSESTREYPYTHRVEIDADNATLFSVAKWLEESGLRHTHIGWSVFYLTEESATAFLLKWS